MGQLRAEREADPADQQANAARADRALENGRGAERRILALQRKAGNAAVSRLLDRQPRRAGGSPGEGLPGTAGGARRVLGPVADQVRVHRESGTLAERPSALAATHGLDIRLAQSAPPLSSPEGQVLLAHESVHVAQQLSAGEREPATDAEGQADQAALAALAGRPLPGLGSAVGPQYFEARMHQASLTDAMAAAGFTDAEQEAAYFANWCRDVSQALVPTLADTVGIQGTTTLIQIIAQQKFGRTVTPAQLGMYDPVEHIDNPAGQINRDLIQDRTQGLPVPVAGRGQYGTPTRDLSPQAMASAFEVDDSGVPAYLDQSKNYIKEQATLALEKGRNAEGLLHVGNFSHTIEDLFAHSNWVEAAVGKLIKDGTPPLDLTPEARADTERRVQLGQPPVETYAAEVLGKGNQARPILMTGTFSPGAQGHDTLISIKAEVQNILAEVHPFGPEGSTEKWWALGLEVLRNVEAAAEEGDLGAIFADHIGQAMANAGRALTGATGGMISGARRTFGEGTTGDIAVGGARLLNQLAHGAVQAGGYAWESVMRGAITEAVDFLGGRLDLVKIAIYLKHGGEELEQAWGVIKRAITSLPKEIRDVLLPELARAEERLKERLREMLEAAWRKGVETLVDSVESAIGKVDVAESPVYRKLESMRQTELPELRSRLVQIIREVAPAEAGQGAIAAVNAASPQELVAIANHPDMANMLGALAEADRAAVMAALDPATETAERIAQIEAMPEWARMGASHSQLAKDHADSPFFGAAFVVANAADRTLVQLVADAWAEAGQTGPTPELNQKFSDQAEPEGERLNATIDEQAMERERQRGFVRTRSMAARIVNTGHAEPLPVEALIQLADELVAAYQPLARDVRRYRFLRPGVDLIDGMIRALREGAAGRVIIEQAGRVRAWLAANGDRLAQQGLDEAAARIALLLGRSEGVARDVREVGHAGESREQHAAHAGETPVQHAAHGPHDDETPEQHAAHAHHPDESAAAHHLHAGLRSEAHFEEQVRALDQFRGAPGRLVQPADGVQTEGLRDAKGRLQLDAAVANAEGVRDRLMAEIDRIFAHPYDSEWWRPVLIPWAQQHSAMISQAILDRNRGDIHSH